MTTGSARRLTVIVGLATAICLAVTGCRSDTDEPRSITTTVVVSTSELTRTTVSDQTGASVENGPLVATIPTTTTTTRAPSTTSTTVLAWSLPEELEAQIEELIAVTEGLRGRTFDRRPDVVTITPDESADLYSVDSGVAHRGEIRRQAAFLELLGMATPGADLDAAIADLAAPISEPFYDFERARIVIPTGGEPLDEFQRWVLVGELVHALANQHNPALVDTLSGSGEDPDRVAARLALLKGEAVLVQSLYLDSLSPETRAGVASQAAERSGTTLDDAPSMLRMLARFPSRAGSFLAVELYRLGGMAAIDQALLAPPDTTEQVLHTERYRRLEPAIKIDSLDVVADGYLLVEHGTWGERRWRALLDDHSGAVTAARAAEGWGGDHYQILWEPGTQGLVLLVRYAADSFADLSEMNSAIRNLITSGIEAGTSSVVGTVSEWAEGVDYVMLDWDVDVITFVVASDPVVGREIVSQIGVGT